MKPGLLISTKSIVIGWLFIQFVFLIVLNRAYPLPTPITDDWLYLNLGSHQENLVSFSLFELINGHQQVLVKFIVWLLGFFAINYLQTFALVNILLVLFGTYFLIMSFIKIIPRKPKKYQVVFLLVLLCNYKALYLYMSVTGMGLCMTYFLYGVYYFAPTRFSEARSRNIQLVVAFISPFTTGFGLSLTLSHLVLIIRNSLQNKSRFSRQLIYQLVISISGIICAYVIPTFFGLFNADSPGHSSQFSSKLINVFADPIHSLMFLAGLIGSVLTPSSRLDPNFPIAVGAALLIAILVVFITVRYAANKVDSQVSSDSLPLLPSVIFMFLLIVFRSSGDATGLLESAAPRYVMGSSLFLFSCYALLVSKISFRNSTTRVILLVSSACLALSGAGTKTGLEWIKVRSAQSYELNRCLDSNKSSVFHCVPLAWEIREGDSDPDQVQENLETLLRHKQ